MSGDRCDWAAVHLCPLYIASHEGALHESAPVGCVDDMARPCRVARGEARYHEELRRVIATRLVLPDHVMASLAVGGRA